MAIARMILSSRHGAAYGAALCWLGLLAAPARAQVSVELGPYLGVYVPTSSFESAAQSLATMDTVSLSPVEVNEFPSDWTR